MVSANPNLTLSDSLAQWKLRTRCFSLRLLVIRQEEEKQISLSRWREYFGLGFEMATRLIPETPKISTTNALIQENEYR